MICVQTLEILSSWCFHHSAAILCSWSLPFIVCCRNGADSAQGRCLAGGRYTPFLMIARKKGTRTGFTNDNKTITKTITFGIKNDPCETLPCLSFSFPFPFLFPVSSFTLPLLFLFLLLSFFLSFFLYFFVSFSVTFPFLFLSLSFSFPFPFPFLFLSFSFSFRFPFLFLSLSFSFPFPFPFLFLSLSFSSPFPILSFPFLYHSFSLPFPRSCEFFDQGVKPALGKTIRGEKNDNVWKKPFDRARSFLQTPI